MPAGVSGFFIGIKSFRSHYGPGVESASKGNEYQEHFLRVNDGRCVRLTISPPSCAFVMKTGNLNFLETSGTLQACNGTALLLPGVKIGRCVRLTTLPPSCADCLEMCDPQPPGTLRACPGLYRDCFLRIH